MLPEMQKNFRLSGLKNLGNTCFLNAVIQCLCTLHSFLEALEKDTKAPSTVARSFLELVRIMKTRAKVAPIDLWRKLAETCPALRANECMDTIECFMLMLRSLHDDADDRKRFETYHFRSFGLTPSTSKNCPSVSIDSPVVDFFTTQLQLKSICGRCGLDHSLFASVFYLSLVLPPPYACAACGTDNKRLRFCSRCRDSAYCSRRCQATDWAASHKDHCRKVSTPLRRNDALSLEALIQDKFELTFSEDPRSCDRCDFPLESFRTRIWSHPKIFVVHLDRNSAIHGMITTLVECPLNSFHLDSTSVPSSTSSPQQTRTCFDLKAVIEHHDASGEGHFVAIVRNDSDDSWYRASDDEITRCESIEVISPRAYMLFYQARNLP